MGCPIRRSRDQRLLASPPGLSQRATPFIASQCQGIHQMPLRRSIPDMASAISDKTRHSQGQKPPRKRRFFMKTLYLIRRMNIPARLSPPAINTTRTRHPPRSHSLHLSKNNAEGRNPQQTGSSTIVLAAPIGLGPLAFVTGALPVTAAATSTHHKP